jgi:hypothetical protein
MSKRFGRNQKRRMRDEQARLSEALEMSRGLARHLSDQKRAVESELTEAKDFALQFSAALPPQTMQLEGPARDVEVYEAQRFDFASVGDTSRMDTTIRRLPLRMLFAEVENDSFRRALHCKVKFGDGRWGYGITEAALVQMPRGRLVRLISEQIAEQIVRDARLQR